MGTIDEEKGEKAEVENEEEAKDAAEGEVRILEQVYISFFSFNF